MKSSKLKQETKPNVSIFIVNSSDSSIDNVTSVIKTQIDSGRRPYVTSLSHETIQEATNSQNFLKTFIEQQLEKCRITMEESQRFRDFNQLDQWKEEIEMIKNKQKRSSSGIKRGFRNQLSKKRDLAKNVIVDFPLEHESTELYLILFDFYDFEIVKFLVSFDTSLKAIINLFPRNLCDKNELSSVKGEEFWDKLMAEKNTQTFSDVAFLDLDVPVESDYILNLRSQLIYDQFCHFLYDIEDIKSSYASFFEHLVIVDVNVDSDAGDFEGMRKRLDEIPDGMLTVEIIYDAILDQLSSGNGSRKSSLKTMLKRPLKVDVFEKNFSDINDKLLEAFLKQPKLYEKQIEKLEISLNLWSDVENVSLEKRQLLNYYMTKLVTMLESADHLEFYIYALQFKAMGKVCETTKVFYENRSGLELKSRMKPSKSTVSDFYVDYKNEPKIPEEISQLVDDLIMLQDKRNEKTLNVSMFSPPAMIQYLSFLMESHGRKFSCQHFKLLDVILIRFHERALPNMFSTKTYKKTLPTPLCFRDFNDFVKHELKLEKDVDLFAQGDVCTKVIKPEHFVLKSSLKYQQMEIREDSISEEIVFAETTENRRSTAVEVETQEVFNVSNERIQFHLTESEFNSIQLVVKASNFHWLNRQKVLNLSCQLQDVHLSVSHDFLANQTQLLSLTTSDGTKCIFEPKISDEDKIQHFLKLWKILIMFPNGMAIKVHNDGAVEQYGLEKSPDGESKRVLFSNGFVMIVYADEAKRVLASNGTIFELNGKSRQSSMGIRKTQKDVSGRKYDKEATQLHQDSITSIHFLKNLFDLSTFKMTLPCGEVFSVEHDMIIDKLETIESEQMLNKVTGSLHIIRADGIKIMYTEDLLKCRFPDGTLITTWLNDDSLKTYSNDVDITSPILHEIWWSGSKKEAEMVVNQAFNRITNDDGFYVNINAVHQFEHEKYGVVRFDDKINFELHEDMSFQVHSDNFLMALEGGVTFRINGSDLSLQGEMCKECFRSNEAFMNFLNVKCDDDEVLYSARDFNGNTFNVKKDGRHAFYDSSCYLTRKCSHCTQVQSNYELEQFGERCVVLNRDNSGYEISSVKVKSRPFSETPDEILFVDDSRQKFTFHINDEDMNSKMKPMSISKDVTDLSTSSSHFKISSESVKIKSKKKKKKAKKSILKDLEIIQAQPIEESTVPQWLTENPSISEDVSIEHKNLIQFYDNLLKELPASIAVGPRIKLNNKFIDVTNALVKLKTYSSEKFIFNVSRLMETPVGKKTFEENFKLVVRKTVENHIQEQLECFRRRLADAVINDLLDTAVKSEDKVRSDVEISGLKTDDLEMGNTDISTSTPPVAIKSFSFS